MEGWITPGFIWFVVGVVLVLLEFAVPGVLLVFFGAGALLTAALSWSGVLVSSAGQLVFFGVSSLALLFGLRRYVAKFFKGDTVTEKDEEYIGRTAKALTDIIPNEINGRVFFQGTNWNAESDVHIRNGSVVRVTGKKNITLMVAPMKEE